MTIITTDTPVWNLQGLAAWCLKCGHGTDHNTGGHDKRDQNK